MVLRVVFTLPRHLWLFLGIQVNPDESVDILVNVNREQSVLALVEPIQLLVARSLGQLAVQPV